MENAKWIERLNMIAYKINDLKYIIADIRQPKLPLVT